VLEHFSDEEIIHILKESGRVTRRAVFSLVPNARSMAYRLGKHHQETSRRWAYGYEDPKFSMAHLFRAAGLHDVEEFTVAALHSLAFLDAPELAPARALWQSFLAGLNNEDLRRMQQGYLLASVGHVRAKRRLAVVPSDPLEEYEKAGYGSWLEKYYNPDGFFDEVYCLSPLEREARFAHGMKVVPTPETAFTERVRSLGIDVVRAYGGYWAADLACGRQVPGVPVVVSLHDARPAWLHDSVRDATRVVAVSGSVRDLAVSRGIPAERLVSIPNRVDFRVFTPITDPQTRADWAARFPVRFRILHVGRRDPVKNLDSLLRALALLGNDYGVIGIGRGDVEPYQTLAAELGITNRCWFIDSVPSAELPVFYSGCSCMCTPSRNEGFGIVFVEALACEAVVVASDIAPMNEYIRHEKNGLLVKQYEEPQALAEMLERACNDEFLRQQLQSQARESVRAFEWDHVSRQEARMYEELLTHHSRTN
jgi:glycosyltransferase involved in cell wall biosynthesis